METTNVLEAARAEDRVSALWIIGAAPAALAMLKAEARSNRRRGPREAPRHSSARPRPSAGLSSARRSGPRRGLLRSQ